MSPSSRSIRPGGVQPVTIGNSDGVQVGDWAVAIGSPFGLEASVTAGIVSATGRDIGGNNTFQRFIQTDAAINPGNSGGPLLNIRGEVIGVNTMIATQSGGYQGIGFALPMNMAVKVYNDVIRSGRVTRGSIGISWNKNDKPDLLRALGTNHGVLVSDVLPNGPAQKAGLKAEDIILSLNGKSIKDGDDLVNRVADLPVGSPADITVDRSGKKLDFKLTVGDRAEVLKERQDYALSRPHDEQVGPETQEARFGVNIRKLNEAERDSVGALGKDGSEGNSCGARLLRRRYRNRRGRCHPVHQPSDRHLRRGREADTGYVETGQRRRVPGAAKRPRIPRPSGNLDQPLRLGDAVGAVSFRAGFELERAIQ